MGWSLQMWFRIEIEHHLFAGFSLFDTEAVSEAERICPKCSHGL